MLLVIDNCEHLIDEVAKFCDELLSAGPEARLLATSREALDLDGEHTFRVGPLAMPEADSEFDEHVPAVELFVTRARNVRGGVRNV
jgi:predicted ATPase